MTHRFLISAACACLLTTPAFGQHSAPLVTRMGNGLTLIIQPDYAADLVAANVWVKAGSANETRETNGISHLIEHLVFGATRTRKPGEVDREMESLGATLDARTSRDWANFSTTTASRHLAKALDVLADVVSGAQFHPAELERERPIILDELARKESDAMTICRDHLAARLYGDHPYALPVEGTPATIKSIKRQDILDYYHKHYVAPNMAVVLVGAVDSQQAIEQVGKAFQRVAAGPGHPTDPGAVAPVNEQAAGRITAPYKLNYLAIGFLGPEGSEEADVCATDVMLTYLGFGYRSWMADELKGRMGLAMDVDADFLTQRRRGLISLIAATTPDNTEKARGAIFARLASLRSEGIPEPALSLAKRSLLGQYAFQNETYAGRANSLGFYYAVLDDPEFAVRYVNRVQAVSNEDIIRVARRYMDPATAVVLTVGPEQGGAR